MALVHHISEISPIETDAKYQRAAQQVAGWLSASI